MLLSNIAIVLITGICYIEKRIGNYLNGDS